MYNQKLRHCWGDKNFKNGRRNWCKEKDSLRISASQWCLRRGERPSLRIFSRICSRSFYSFRLCVPITQEGVVWHSFAMCRYELCFSWAPPSQTSETSSYSQTSVFTGQQLGENSGWSWSSWELCWRALFSSGKDWNGRATPLPLSMLVKKGADPTNAKWSFCLYFCLFNSLPGSLGSVVT